VAHGETIFSGLNRVKRKRNIYEMKNKKYEETSRGGTVDTISWTFFSPFLPLPLAAGAFPSADYEENTNTQTVSGVQDVNEGKKMEKDGPFFHSRSGISPPAHIPNSSSSIKKLATLSFRSEAKPTK
jgi:hypothetical protein